MTLIRSPDLVHRHPPTAICTPGYQNPSKGRVETSWGEVVKTLGVKGLFF